MMMFDKKRMMSTIMSGRKDPNGERLSDPAPMKNEEVKDSDGEIDPRHLASQDMLSAFHEKSPMKLMDAMSSFIDLHMSKNSEEPEGLDDKE